MTSALHMLSPHFSLAEMCRSDYALRHAMSNEPGDTEIGNLSDLCNRVLEPIRALTASPVYVSSGYRNPQLNAAIGGSQRSQHILGQAADFVVPGFTNTELMAIIANAPGVPFDQLIHEGNDDVFGWIHCSYSPQRRREVLAATFGPSGVTYSPYRNA